MQRRIFQNLIKQNLLITNKRVQGLQGSSIYNLQAYRFSTTQKEDIDLNQFNSEIEQLKKKVGANTQPNSSMQDEQLNELSQFEAFQSASRYASLEKFELAEQKFQEALNILNEQQSDRIDLQIILMKRLALMYKLQDKNYLLTPLLEDLYFKHLAFYSYKNVDYIKILKNLLTHYCIYDLERGSIFLEMILEQLQQEEIPKVIVRDIYFYAGIIHALKGDDFNQSERFLQESIQAGLQPIQKGIAYNNLACVTYWNCLNLLLELSQTTKEEEEKQKQLQAEIQERIQLVAPLIKRAFHAFEFEEKNRQKDQINEQQFMILKKLFDEGQKAFDLTGLKPEDVLLKNPMSSICAMNMGEFLFYSGDFNASQFWLQVSQYSSTKLESLHRVLRTIVISALAAKKQNKIEFAENLLIDCLEYSENYTTFNKVFALESYSQILKQQGRNYEANSYQQQSDNLRNVLSFWDERKENIIIPDYDFKF
ncbi:hypothetical protein ABPG72_002305 [Tetrahymena utriculariae]